MSLCHHFVHWISQGYPCGAVPHHCPAPLDIGPLTYIEEGKRGKERMNMIVVGKEKVDYPSKKTGKQVRGVSFNCVCDTHDERFEGQRVDTVFISMASPMYDQCAAFPVGSEISVMYNRYGSVESVVLCEPRK